jgi:hypothetical protein
VIGRPPGAVRAEGDARADARADASSMTTPA